MNEFPIIPGEAFSADQLAMLAAPLTIDTLKERVGAGGKKLKYIDGKTAIDTANRIFGRGKWGFRIVARTHEKVEYKDGSHKEYFTADIELYVAGNPFPFPGDGMGALQSPTVEGIEMARKDAVTDALKRALCYYGDQFGLALRDEESLVEVAEGVMVHVNEVQVNKNGANTVKPSAAARINAAPEHRAIAAPSKVVESTPAQQNGNGTSKLPRYQSLADLYYPGGWASLATFVAQKANVIGLINDEQIIAEYLPEVQAELGKHKPAKQPVAAS